MAISEPNNLHQTRQALMARRASLSPSKFSPSLFRDFQQKSARALFENEVMSTVIPIFCGPSKIPNQQDVLFTEFAPITDKKKRVKPKPDFFDGARFDELSQEVRDDAVIGSTVIPTRHRSVPIAPNFYMEVKGQIGSDIVAQRQACYDGSYGARAMHALQNYGHPEPIYDGNAYTYSSTYQSGTLKIFAHHVTAPKILGGRPEYHMTQIDSWGLDGNINTFIVGATAFRNARELAERHRRSFIEAANSRASKSGAVADSTVEESDDMDHSINRADCGWQNADDTLQ